MEKTIIDKGASNEIFNEFKEISDTSIKAWLIKKNIINDADNLNNYKDLFPWKRGGAETYITQFEISYTTSGILKNKKILIKAIVSTPIEQSLINWSNRRKKLLANKINVSHWYWNGNGVIIEDYYPKDHTYSELTKLIDIAIILDSLGFKTTHFLSDIRCDENNNPYYIDFGFDLGQPSEKATDSSLKNVLKMFPEKEEFIKNYTLKS